ncbi:MAG: DUF3667 domain-containing protein, partial [Caulobacterales bacterium]
AALEGAGGVVGRAPKHVLPVGAACPNCGTTLAGRWCHACGQSAEDFHRSILRLAAEVVGGLFDVDSRLWRTLPRLFFRPARLTREYLDGHRAAQAPPFRLFLIVVVVVFLAAGAGGGNGASSPSGHAQTVLSAGHEPHINIDNNPALTKWMTDRVRIARAHPDAFEATLTAWAQRLVFLALPVSAALLGLMFFWRRSVFIFDHLIFSMHSLSFQGLLLTAMMLGERLSGWFGLLIFASPVHLFVHMRGTYGVGVFGTLARMFILFFGSLIAFAVIMVGLLLIGFYEVGA